MGRFALKASRGRFSNTVITKFKAYLDNPDIAKQDNPVLNRPPSQRCYIEPFSVDLAADQRVKVSASTTAISTYLSKVNTGAVRLESALPGDGTAITLGRFRSARVQIKTGVSNVGTPKISKTSGLPYKSYGGNSISIPFGRSTPTEDEATAFQAIRASIVGGGGSAAPLVSLIQEIYAG